MENDFLKEEDFLLPNPRVINGFRILPIWSLPNSSGSRLVIWMIRPNKSVFSFFFSTLKSATAFALFYSNCHTDKFWFHHFKREFHYSYVSRQAFCHESR